MVSKVMVEGREFAVKDDSAADGEDEDKGSSNLSFSSQSETEDNDLQKNKTQKDVDGRVGLADTKIKLILQLKLIISCFVRISMGKSGKFENTEPNAESNAESNAFHSNRQEFSAKDSQRIWQHRLGKVAGILDTFMEEYPMVLINTVELALKTTGDIQRAIDAVFERAFLVTLDGFLMDMVKYGFKCNAIRDGGSNKLEIFLGIGGITDDTEKTIDRTKITKLTVHKYKNKKINLLYHMFGKGKLETTS